MIAFLFVFLPMLMLIYTLFMGRLIYSSKREVIANKSTFGPELSKISVIIAFRNEAESMRKLLKSLASIDYPKDAFEVLLINDHSEDNFLTYLDTLPGNFSYLNSDSNGKKAAIDFGIKRSQFDWILTTDADCSFDKDWLRSANRLIQQNDADLYVLPVIPVKSSKAIVLYQYLESLINLSFNEAYFKAFNDVLLASGANLLYQKSSYQELNPYENNMHIASGDDMFLLQSFKKGRKAIAISNEKGLWVETKGLDDISSMVKQRLRWLSKMKNLKRESSFTIGLIASIIHLSIGLGLILSFFFPKGFWIVVLFLFLKSLMERELIKRFLCRKVVLPPFYQLFLFEFLSLFSVPFLVILSIFRTSKWKGRETIS